MAEVIADLFISVDGHGGSSRSPGYFGFGGPDLDRWIRREMERPQRLVMGRRTYEVLAAVPEEVRDEGSQLMAATPTVVVFSRTLRAVSWPHATICREDVVEKIRDLKADGPDLRTIGSLSVVRQLLAAGLVDRLRLAVFPLVLGETGREPVFTQLPDIGLELECCSVLDGRVLLTDCRPAGAPPYRTE
jgi:dihydrofolate reductase